MKIANERSSSDFPSSFACAERPGRVARFRRRPMRFGPMPSRKHRPGKRCESMASSRFAFGNSVHRKRSDSGGTAVIYANGRCAGRKSCGETRMDGSIGDGCDCRHGGAPVRVKRDVLSGSVAEGAHCCELLSCSGGDRGVRWRYGD